jgi:hypothetical protein
VSIETLHRRLKIAALLTCSGLAVQVTTLFLSHPLTFIAFITIGGTLVGMGVLLYLYAVVSR